MTPTEAELILELIEAVDHRKIYGAHFKPMADLKAKAEKILAWSKRDEEAVRAMVDAELAR